MNTEIFLTKMINRQEKEGAQINNEKYLPDKNKIRAYHEQLYIKTL